MKPILATIALLLVSGCASKPKPQPVMDAAKWNTITENVFRHHELPPEGVVWHVTREQWEAAQGLYVIYLCTDQDVPVGLKDCYPTEEFPSGHSILNPFPVNDSTPTLFLRPDGKRMTYGELRKWAKQSPPSGDAK